MYIVTVIPIKKEVFKEYLTYFSATKIPLGTIVVVPLKFKKINALVVNIEDVLNLKTNLKKENYQLKKIIEIKGSSPFTNDFFLACQRMKEYTVGNLNSIIKTFLPNVFLENFKELKIPLAIKKEEDLENLQNIKQEKLIFQTLITDRISWYRTLIREAFAKKQSVFICVPTLYDIEVFKNELIKGIDQYVFCFHHELNKKDIISNYNKVITENHPILIIATGSFLSIPRNDLKTIIIEQESSNAYKQLYRPYLDIRNFIEIFSAIKKIKLIFGDNLLRPETLYRHEIKELGEVFPPNFRLSSTENQIIVNLKDEKIENKKENNFNVLSKTAQKTIQQALDDNESVFLFSVRKGLAPLTICHDCQNILLCPDCSVPIVLYGNKKKDLNKEKSSRIFMCNKCGKKEKSEIFCPVCNSWNLTSLGIGSDLVYEETKKFFPKANVFQIDKENSPTDKEARKTISLFYKNPGSILIGTEMAFSYLNQNINNSIVVSLDSLLSIPSFNITQKILHLIEKLNYLTIKNLIIQTRIPENNILKHILSKNVLPLYRQDLEERKQFNYPPFKRLIKITFTGTTQETEKARILIEKLLGKYDPQIFSAFIGKIKGQYITNTVIKVNLDSWPLLLDNKKKIDKSLTSSLSLLPPSFLINVDPEDLL